MRRGRESDLLSPPLLVVTPNRYSIPVLNLQTHTMQFQYNADYPGDTEPRPPLDFPSAQPIPCARLKTRIIHNSQSIMAEPVLVRTVSRRRQSVLQHIAHDADDASMASSSSSSSGSSSNSSMDDGPPSTHPQAQQQQTTTSDCAYWIQRTVREAIYGRVLFAVVLKKGINGVWESTNQHCAIKELSWQHIRRERDRLAEDPIKEVSAMQHLKEWIASTRRIPDNGNNGDPVASSFEYMLHTNIMMPLDLLSDERYLYSIMPYCNGGELFELLDMNERFSEPEARYWMTQVLNVRQPCTWLDCRTCCSAIISLLCLYSKFEGPRKFTTRRHLPPRHESRKFACPRVGSVDY